MSFFKKLMILFGISLIVFYGCDRLLGPDPKDTSQNDEISITGPSFLAVNGDEYKRIAGHREEEPVIIDFPTT